MRIRVSRYFTEMRRRHIEKHRVQHEIHKRIDDMLKENSQFRRYHRHNRFSQISIILFNAIVWFLIFRYLGAQTVVVAFAIIMTTGGILQLLFHMNLEKKVFSPINQMKAGVDEIAKGNYDINIKCEGLDEITALVHSFNDMALKLLEGEKLKAVYEENRKTLIANISHDLKTPITSIQGYIETMLERQDIPKENMKKYHQIIYNNTAYMNKLIDDLFLFSKLDMQKLELQLEIVDARAFMNDLMEEFKIELEDKNIAFLYEDKLTDNYSIKIDRKRVSQIFRNIIGNAVKYGTENNVKIKTSMYKQQDSIYIDIEDNGQGIPQDKLAHIFDRFYRVDYARTKDLMSTGLGLAIAKELTEAQDGSISVTSKENIGTCFTVMLPILKNNMG